MALFAEFGRVWIFNAEGSHFPGGVFSSKSTAESWIEKHKLTGTLTLYPVDEGVYDLFIAQGWFRPKREEHLQASFIGGFTQASQDHEHYEDGRRVSDLIDYEK